MTPELSCFPATRYQGSKRKLLPALDRELAALTFDTVLDAFGGTGAVAWLLKARGKEVTYNDLHRFNHAVGRALVENRDAALTRQDALELTEPDPARHYDSVVARAFPGIFFTDPENDWIDITIQNIAAMEDGHPRAIAQYALFQACLLKRPFNLFHRANLNLRLRDVPRSFGNKTTWETPFTDHFLATVEAANRAVFCNGRANRATCHDALRYPEDDFDLVYVDPPYMDHRGRGTDYLDYYHFLEGLLDYARWESRIDPTRKHRPLRHDRSDFGDPSRIRTAFTTLIARFPRSALAISYRSDGVPSVEEITGLLADAGRRSEVRILSDYRYVLSRNGASKECLILSPRP